MGYGAPGNRTPPYFYEDGLNIKHNPLLQNLFFVFVGPSLKTWPWCAPHFAQWYSVLIIPKEKSTLVLKAPGSASENEGQPVPLSNFASELNNLFPQFAQW